MLDKTKQRIKELDTQYVKGEFFYIDYKRVPREKREEMMARGMKAGLSRILLGLGMLVLSIWLIILCIRGVL